MTETATLHPELTADLVERVANLSPEAVDSLRNFLNLEAELDAEYKAQIRAHIREITLRVVAGTEPTRPVEEAMAKVDEYLRGKDLR